MLARERGGCSIFIHSGRTDSSDKIWEAVASHQVRDGAGDFIPQVEGMRLIQRCADSHYLALPVRVILRDREDNATAWIDDRWFWARIYYVGSPGAGDYGLVKGVLLPKQAYPKLTK